MDRLHKLFKKSPEKPQQHISLGISTNIAAGPLGFRAELDIGPKGELDRLSRLQADRPDLTVTLDKKDTRASRIVFHNEDREDQALPTPGTPTTGAAVGGDEHEDVPTGERL